MDVRFHKPAVQKYLFTVAISKVSRSAQEYQRFKQIGNFKRSVPTFVHILLSKIKLHIRFTFNHGIRDGESHRHKLCGIGTKPAL